MTLETDGGHAISGDMTFDARFLRNLALAILPVLLCSWVGGAATQAQIPTWYAGLVKPWFNPPNWIFPIAWTALFALMAWAVFRVLQTPEQTAGRRAAITAYFIQLALNCGWSFAFFAARSPLLGLVVIIPFLGMILVTIWRFGAVDKLAARLLWPYAAWVTFATVLNIAIWRLNG
jgi:translocator protein